MARRTVEDFNGFVAVRCRRVAAVVIFPSPPTPLSALRVSSFFVQFVSFDCRPVLLRRRRNRSCSLQRRAEPGSRNQPPRRRIPEKPRTTRHRSRRRPRKVSIANRRFVRTIGDPALIGFKLRYNNVSLV